MRSAFHPITKKFFSFGLSGEEGRGSSINLGKQVSKYTTENILRLTRKGVCASYGDMCQSRKRQPDQRSNVLLKFVHCNLGWPIEPTAKDGFKTFYLLQTISQVQTWSTLWNRRVIPWKPREINIQSLADLCLYVRTVKDEPQQT